jgi:hypothetical protein
MGAGAGTLDRQHEPGDQDREGAAEHDLQQPLTDQPDVRAAMRSCVAHLLLRGAATPGEVAATERQVLYLAGVLMDRISSVGTSPHQE